MTVSSVHAPNPVLALPTQPHIMGIGVLPPELRQHAYPHLYPTYDQANHEAALLHHSLAKRLTHKVGKGFGAAQDFRRSLKFSWFARNVRNEIEENFPPDEIFRFVFDAEGRENFPPDATLSKIEEGDPEEFPGGPEADLAYENAGIVFDFFKEHLGVVIPQPMVQLVNFNHETLFTRFENAFFAPMLFGAHLVVYGQGDDYVFNSPAGALDIIGHEYAHFYLDSVFPDKFTYYGQPGALNEHIADVIGTCVKAKEMGVDSNHYPRNFWKLGAGWLVDRNLAIRNMWKPGTAYHHPAMGKDTQPAHMKDFKVTLADMGGVHANSGIMNRAFALFCRSVDSPSYEIPLQIWKRAIALVKPQPTFQDFAQTLLQVAREFDTYPQHQGMEIGKKMESAIRRVGVLEWGVVGNKVVKLR